MQITLFGISADVRRKTPRDHYHFARLRTIQCFGSSADVRRKTAQDYFHFSAPTQVTIFFISVDVRRKTPRVYYHFAHLRTIQCWEFLRIYANFIVVEM